MRMLNQRSSLLPEVARLNDFLGLSLNNRTILFFGISFDKIVSVKSDKTVFPLGLPPPHTPSSFQHHPLTPFAVSKRDSPFSCMPERDGPTDREGEREREKTHGGRKSEQVSNE